MIAARLRRLVGPSPLFSRALLASYAAAGLNQVGTVVLSTVLPFHVTALGGSKVDIGLLFSAMTVTSMIARPLAGRWADHYGVRLVLLPGAVVLGLSSLALQVAPDPQAIIAAMMAVGIGSALVSTGATVLNTRASAPPDRSEALGLYYLSTSLAVGAGPAVALVLWRFGGIHLALMAATATAGALVALAVSAAVGMGGDQVVALAGFQVVSRPALPLSAVLILSVLGHSSMYAFLPLYAVSVGRGRSVPLFFSAYALCMIGGRIFFRRLPDRVGRERAVGASIILVALGFAGLAVPPTPVTLIAAGVVFGSGASVLYPGLAALLVERTPESERGLALGTLSAAWDMAVVAGSVLIGFVVGRTSFPVGFGVSGASAGLGLALFALFERRRGHAAVLSRPAPGV